MHVLMQHPLILAFIENNRFGGMLGMDFDIVTQGEVIYSMDIREKHLATPISAHGGAIASLMDAALGVAGLSAVCEAGKVVSTLEMSVRFIAPGKPGDTLTAHAKVISKGNRILVIQAEMYNQHQTLIATGSGTFNAYPQEKAGL